MAIIKPPKAAPAITEKSQKEIDRMERDFISGAAPKKEKESLVPVVINFSQELLDNIDELARRKGFTRSAWIRFIAVKAIEKEEK